MYTRRYVPGRLIALSMCLTVGYSRPRFSFNKLMKVSDIIFLYTTQQYILIQPINSCYGDRIVQNSYDKARSIFDKFDAKHFVQFLHLN